MSTLLLIAIFLPAVGAAILAAMTEAGHKAVRGVALGFSCAALLTASYLTWQYTQLPVDETATTSADAGRLHLGGESRENFAAVDYTWFESEESNVNIHFSLGLDGLGLWMFALSALLVVICVLVSWEAIRDRAAGFYALLLLLEMGMLGVFAARDLMLFYVFFEFTLFPLFFLIGIWGSEERRYAAIKFFLVTFTGSVLTLLGMMTIALASAETSGELTFSISQITANLAENPLSETLQFWVFLALFAGFAVKVPLFPFHTWLPLAHVQAPTAGSVLLAGVLLKMGTYGFVRFSLPMLPAATVSCMPWVLWLSVIGIIYGALVALAQRDIKRLIAYSSVSHLGFCMLGIFALNRLGLEGGVLQMINHGISTGGLFAIVGMIYERYHTRQISELGGLAKRTPCLAFFMLVMTLSSIGLPGLNGFAGEFLLLTGMFQRGWFGGTHSAQFLTISVLAVSGVILGAWYMLSLVRRVFFGPLKEPYHEPDEPPVRDLSLREIAALTPLALCALWIGLFPGFFLDQMRGTLDPLSAKAVEQFEAQQTRNTIAFSQATNTTPVASGTSLVETRGSSRLAVQVESTERPMATSLLLPVNAPAPISAASVPTSPQH
ncbi:MAG: NADH-quinone oxidoreductase subunit M [Pirellulales bacterium]|nr:NADH-quinone oxidoreductase subunit M [Pirellulales bacterium]